VLNKPRGDKFENFITTDINENQKEYELPGLPEGIFIIGAFVKEDK